MKLRAAKKIRGRRRGFSFIYITAILLAFCAIVSFAVDYGRVQLAKTQLRAASDAGARAAATALGTVTTAQDLAIQYAGLNKCDGVGVLVDRNNDIDFLYWDTSLRTYTTLTGSSRAGANAIRVTCQRTAARSNPIPLTFAKLVGMSNCDVKASAIAAVIPPGYGLVGINYISLKGNSTASYWSSDGSVAGNSGAIASNGFITSSNNATISGTAWSTNTAWITGVNAAYKRTLTTPLSYPNGDPGSARTTNDDGNIAGNFVSNQLDLTVGANKTCTIPGGTYYFRNVTLSSTAICNFTGPATIYFYGSFSMSSTTTTNMNLPKNLVIIGVPASNGSPTGAFSVGSSAALYANIYVPQSDITFSGSGGIYGAVVGKSVTMTGTSDVYYDLSLAGGSGVVQMVK